MLQQSFMFIPGVRHRTERRLWLQGIRTWERFLHADRIAGFSAERKGHYDRIVRDAQRAFSEGDATFFGARLPATEHYRLYPAFRDACLFLDIETSNAYGDVTVVGLSDGESMKTLVKGVNLHESILQDAFSRSKVLITFNGSSFDLPILRRTFHLPLMPHIDLRHVATRLGYGGGLKQIEQELGLKRRESVQGMQGSDACAYWHLWKLTGNRKYLQTLLDYNEEDVMNLRVLADRLIPKVWEHTVNVIERK